MSDQMATNNSSNSRLDGAFEAEMAGNPGGADTLPPQIQAASTDPAKDEQKKIRYRAKPKYPLPIAAKVVAIDLDGTLIDTASDIATAVNKMRAAFGFGDLPIATVRNFIGRGIPNLVSQSMKSAVGELGASASKVAVAQFEKQYAACFAEQSQPYPQVLDGLALLREKGFKLACITNKAQRFAVPLLETLGLSRFFDLVVSGDSLPEKKPHPLPLEHTAKHFAVSNQELVMIGDSMHDAAAARAAGSPVFVVTYGYNEGQELRGLDCDAFLDDLPSALKYVRVDSQLSS
jgi:phosphoglycolate phosphatase